MPGKIVIHAGFHKTGTTSVQRFIKANSQTLWPLTAIAMRPRFPEVLSASRGYSTWRDPLALAKFTHRFDAFVRDINLGENRRLVISAEELSGHIPGRGDLADYSATPHLMEEIVSVFEDIFDDPNLHFHFSTRAREPWLKSAYWEHVKSSRMTLDFAEYEKKYARSSDLDKVVKDIRKAVGPHPVSTLSLEDAADLPLGPADPIIDALGIGPKRRALLTPVEAANTSPSSEVIEAFLAFNRSDMTGPEVGQAKRDYLAALPEDEA